MQPTRIRDLLVVAVVATGVAYLVTRFNYSSIPQLPRLAGLTAALIGVGEGIAGAGLRARIHDQLRSETIGDRPRRPPVPPLLAARALSVAKASALAAAALAGLWLGFGLYVIPKASVVAAADADTGTAIIGLVCAGVLLAGALYLEKCCRTPKNGPPTADGAR